MERWTADQLKVAVDQYFDLRERVVKGEKINKAKLFRDLAKENGKNAASWALRFGNISQVMEDLGLDTISGIRPLSNVGSRVKDEICKIINSRTNGLMPFTAESPSLRAEPAVEPEFCPGKSTDQRRYVIRSIVQRRGQLVFRRSLIETYGGKCVFSNCAIVEILEAAHIYPFMDGPTNDVSNGLLLRADLHTLFDLRLVSVDPKKRTVATCPKLKESEYFKLNGRPLAASISGRSIASKSALEWHRSMCDW